MHLSGSDCACAPQLGDWGEVLTSALTAGAQVYGTQQNVKLQTALAQAVRQRELDDARRAAALLASQQAMPPPLPSDGYSIQLEPDALPSWAIPAAIGGGVLLLALLLRR